MEIRLLQALDAEEYFNLRLEALQKNPEAFAASFEEEKEQPIEKYIIRFQSEDSFTFGAFDKGELVGVVTLIKEKLIKLRHKATIVAMYVLPEKRGMGIGKALLEEVIAKAKEIEGVEQVYLSVVSTNEPAKKLYSVMGFECYGTEKRALQLGDDYYDEDLMVLFLAE